MADVLIYNRRARKQYQILDSFEAGMVLLKNEAALVRKGQFDITGSFARIHASQKGAPEIWLVGSKVSNFENPDRLRKLLLNRREISRLIGSVQAKNLTLVPLKIYSKKGKIKVELGIARGKKQRDRREEIKKRDLELQLKRDERER